MAALEYQTFVSNIATAIARQLQPAAAEAATEAAAAAAASPAITAPAEAYCLDHEKIVWHFPDTAARMIEEVG